MTVDKRFVPNGIYCQPMTFGKAMKKTSLEVHRSCFESKAELVFRGVEMIEDHALDGKTEADLAARLAVSPRHLRRLFLSYTGVTPDGLARAARAHFARRLLDETDLSMTHVAYAAGFTSVRQFNRACREIFHESPRALRARRDNADRLVADGGLRLRLSFHGLLDWDALLSHLAERAIPGVETISGNVYRRTVRCTHPGVIELMPGDEGHIFMLAHLPHWRGLVNAVGRGRDIANLDFTLAEATRALEDDTLTRRLVSERPGVRPPGTWNGFETGVVAVLAQERSSDAATAIAGRLVERYGTPVPGLEQIGLTHTFPSPETLARANLDGLGLSGLEREALRGFAQATASEMIRFDRSFPLERFVKSVAALRGIDVLTAQYLAFRLGEPNAWPVNEHSPDLSALGSRARPWRALAAAHLMLASAGSGDAPTRPLTSSSWTSIGTTCSGQASTGLPKRQRFSSPPED